MDETGTPSERGLWTLTMGVALVRCLTHLRERVIAAEVMFAEWEAMMEARRGFAESERLESALTPEADAAASG